MKFHQLLAFFSLFFAFSYAQQRIAFRLDYVRDFYLNAAQTAIISLFNETKTPLTLGINGGAFGQDVVLIPYLTKVLKDPSWEVEFALHGSDGENITFYSYLEQKTLFQAGLVNIQKALNPKLPLKTFIPMSGDWNSLTPVAIGDLGFQVQSGYYFNDESPYNLDGLATGISSSIRHFPSDAFTGTNLGNSTGIPSTQTIAQLEAQILRSQWAVISINPEDFAPFSKAIGYDNSVNQTQLNELRSVINYVRSRGNTRIVPVGRLAISDPGILLTGSADVPPVNYTCNCIAFRLDDIQDGFLVQHQQEILNLFQEYGIPITIGIITNRFGKDPLIYDRVTRALANPDWCVEIAHHGLNHENFSTFSYPEQRYLMSAGVEKMQQYLGITPTTFIPPLNQFNANTTRVLLELGFTHMSSQVELDKGPYNLVNPDALGQLWRLPKDAATNDETNQVYFSGLAAETVWAQATAQVATMGYSVIMMHPQEFSEITKLGNIVQYTGTMNTTMFKELKKLLDIAKASKYRFTPIGQVHTFFPGRTRATKCMHSYTLKASSNQIVAPFMLIGFLSFFAVFLNKKLY